MKPLEIISPHPFFYDLDGQPLDNGFVWIGQANEDPTVLANQITVYSDYDLTIPIAQPIRTNNGRPYENGAIVRIWVDEMASATTHTKDDVFVEYTPVLFGVIPEPNPATIFSDRYEFDTWQLLRDDGVPTKRLSARVLTGSGKGLWIYEPTPEAGVVPDNINTASGQIFQATGDTSDGLWLRQDVEYREPWHYKSEADLDDDASMQQVFTLGGDVKLKGDYDTGELLLTSVVTSLTCLNNARLRPLENTEFHLTIERPEQYRFRMFGNLELDGTDGADTLAARESTGFGEYGLRIHGMDECDFDAYSHGYIKDGITLESEAGYGIYSNDFRFVANENGRKGIATRSLDGIYTVNGAVAWSAGVDSIAELRAVLDSEPVEGGTWSSVGQRMAVNKIRARAQRNGTIGIDADACQSVIYPRVELNGYCGVLMGETRSTPLLEGYSENNGNQKAYDAIGLTGSPPFPATDTNVGGIFLKAKEGELAAGVKVMSGRYVDDIHPSMFLKAGFSTDYSNDNTIQDQSATFNANVIIGGVLRGAIREQGIDILAGQTHILQFDEVDDSTGDVTTRDITWDDLSANSYYDAVVIDSGSSRSNNSNVHAFGSDSISINIKSQSADGVLVWVDVGLIENGVADGVLGIMNTSTTTDVSGLIASLTRRE